MVIGDLEPHSRLTEHILLQYSKQSFDSLPSL